jgi:hypothetical protein
LSRTKLTGCRYARPVLCPLYEINISLDPSGVAKGKPRTRRIGTLTTRNTRAWIRRLIGRASAVTFHLLLMSPVIKFVYYI